MDTAESRFRFGVRQRCRGKGSEAMNTTKVTAHMSPSPWILLVEDDGLKAEAAHLRLDALGALVTLVTCLDDAIGLGMARYAGVVTDMRFPCTPGGEVGIYGWIVHAIARGYGLPVLVVSGDRPPSSWEDSETQRWRIAPNPHDFRWLIGAARRKGVA